MVARTYTPTRQGSRMKSMRSFGLIGELLMLPTGVATEGLRPPAIPSRRFPAHCTRLLVLGTTGAPVSSKAQPSMFGLTIIGFGPYFFSNAALIVSGVGCFPCSNKTERWMEITPCFSGGRLKIRYISSSHRAFGWQGSFLASAKLTQDEPGTC